MSRPKVYLAGKITGSPWRESIVDGLKTEDRDGWPILARAIEGYADYVGPFPTKNGDGNAHDYQAIEHGSEAINYTHNSAEDTRDCIVRNCINAIRLSNYFFAFIDSVEDVGTIAEIGIAIGDNGRRSAIANDSDGWQPLHSEIWVSSEELSEKMWFVRGCSWGIASTPQDAWLRSETREYLLFQQARDLLVEKHESPIEASLARAIIFQPWGRNLKAQVQIGPYRCDLALPDHRIVIECDGHQYHSSKEQRGNDAKRDRFLAASGWRVIRCTGTEIHADVSRVVADIRAVVGCEQAAKS